MVIAGQRAEHKVAVAAELVEPLIHASAEQIPLADATFDLVISEYGASIWCDPYRWIPEAARLLRPGGLLVLASPMHFDEHYTSRDKWIGDVREVLDPACWSIGDREIDVRYELWQNRRRIISYLSQVIGAVRKPSPAA